MSVGQSLDQQFVKERPREVSGSRSANRFDFQLSYAFSELLRLHELGQSFLMFFDFHEDLVVFDSENQPQGADFIQVKSRKALSNWTPRGLLSVKGEQSPETDSILGKLLENHRKFDDSTQLTFLSNRGLSAKLASGEKAQDFEQIFFGDLDEDVKQTIREKLSVQKTNHSDWDGLNKLLFKRTTLEVDGHVTMTKGLLAEFYQRCYPESKAPIALIYDCISGELRSRNNHEGQYLSFSELRKQKAIGSSDFRRMIRAPLDYETSNVRWERMQQALQADGYTFSQCRKLKQAWERYIVESMDYSNDLLTTLKQSIDEAVSNYEDSHESYTMRSLVDAVVNALSPDFSKQYDANYLKVSVIDNLCNSHEQLPKINTESPKEE